MTFASVIGPRVGRNISVAQWAIVLIDIVWCVSWLSPYLVSKQFTPPPPPPHHPSPNNKPTIEAYMQPLCHFTEINKTSPSARAVHLLPLSPPFRTNRGIFFLSIYRLLHLPPLRFHGVGGCWDRTQDCCDFGMGSHTL